MKRQINRLFAAFTALLLLTGGAAASCSGGESMTYYTPPTGPEKAAITVEPVSGLPEDFICGMDASSVLSEERSGVRYYGFDGQEQDVFLTFALAGINMIRLRVWNDPYDEQGRGYGGGNNDLAAAAELGLRATKYGMGVCIDFHYSDFWADPKRQHAPKAWAGMDVGEKCVALEAFTRESLESLLDAGVDVRMVQIGNEINYGLAGESYQGNILRLLEAGSRAVRAVSAEREREIRIAVHYTNVKDPVEVRSRAAALERAGIDYDILALSYYPFWDGPAENVQQLVSALRERYGREVVIAETSYCYTDEDGDGFANSVSGRGDIPEGYPATVQGQASMLRDVIAAASAAGTAGVFYWEGAWIPVGGREADNSSLWEEYGSGWASSYAGSYDPEDAGLYYGGCSWDNQALFDFSGHPLESLKTFRYLRFGASPDA